jgi:hypothetical protein
MKNGDVVMRISSKLLATAVAAAGAMSFNIAADAAPIMAPSSLQNAAAPPVESVQWRRWGWAPGLAAGAVIGGAIAASRPWYGYNNYYDDYAYAPAYSYGYSPGYSYYSPGYSYGYSPGYSYYSSPGYSYGYSPDYSYSSSGYGSGPSPSPRYNYSPGYNSSSPGSSYAYAPGSSYSSPGSAYAYSPGYSTAGNSASYCQQRFRSYDPASGTYLGYDGKRHPCP